MGTTRSTSSSVAFSMPHSKWSKSVIAAQKVIHRARLKSNPIPILIRQRTGYSKLKSEIRDLRQPKYPLHRNEAGKPNQRNFHPQPQPFRMIHILRQRQLRPNRPLPRLQLLRHFLLLPSSSRGSTHCNRSTPSSSLAPPTKIRVLITVFPSTARAATPTRFTLSSRCRHPHFAANRTANTNPNLARNCIPLPPSSSLTQPAIRPFHDYRATGDSFGWKAVQRFATGARRHRAPC